MQPEGSHSSVQNTLANWQADRQAQSKERLKVVLAYLWQAGLDDLLRKIPTARTCKWNFKIVGKNTQKVLFLQLGSTLMEDVGIRVDGINNLRRFIDYGGQPGTGTWRLSGFYGQLGPFGWDPYFLDTDKIADSIRSVRPETLALVKYYGLQWAANSDSGRQFDSACLNPFDISHLTNALQRLAKTEKFQEITMADPFFDAPHSEDEDITVESSPVLPNPHGPEALAYLHHFVPASRRILLLSDISFEVQTKRPSKEPIRLYIGVCKGGVELKMNGGHVWLYLEKASGETPKYSPDHSFSIEKKTGVKDIPLNEHTSVKIEYVYPFHYAYGDDQQVYALAKYYFMLAAHQNHLGYSRHTIPVNTTFRISLGNVLQKIPFNASKLTTGLWGLDLRLPPTSLPNQVSQPVYHAIGQVTESEMGDSRDDDEMDTS
jgi:hypothetical protein